MSIRPTVHSKEVIEAVAQTIVGNLHSRGGYGEETAIRHIEKVLAERLFDDGYLLTRRLEQDFGWFNCDMHIAEVMDDAYSLLLSEAHQQTAAWVIKNAIQPKRALGDHVNFQYHGNPIEGEIVGILHPHAQYIVSSPALGHSTSPAGPKASVEGLVVNFEDIHDLAESPEHFELREQVMPAAGR